MRASVRIRPSGFKILSKNKCKNKNKLISLPECHQFLKTRQMFTKCGKGFLSPKSLSLPRGRSVSLGTSSDGEIPGNQLKGAAFAEVQMVQFVFVSFLFFFFFCCLSNEQPTLLFLSMTVQFVFVSFLFFSFF